MALSSDDQYVIIRLLGWPANVLNPASLSYSNIVANRLLVIPDAACPDVLSIVTRILALDTALSQAVNESGVKSIDDIEFFGEGEGTRIEQLRKERNRLIMELGSTLDIQPGPGIRGGMMGNIRL